MLGTSRRQVHCSPEGSRGWRVSATAPARTGALLLILVAAAGALVWSAPGPTTAAVAAEATAQTQRPMPGQSLPPLIPSSPSGLGSSPLTARQKQALLKGNFEKMKREADELAQLAKSLQAELNKSNQDVLSLQVVDKAGQIERLAKKIKSTATAY